MTWHYDNIWCFSKYYEDDDLRIFSMTNLQENKTVLEQANIKKTDRFLVLLTWMHPLRWFTRAKAFIDEMRFDENQFYLMCNTETQLRDAHKSGFSNAFLVNRYFVLHPFFYNTTMERKLYDVCIYGEHFQRNRTNYAFHLKNLAIIDAVYKPNHLWKYPECAYRNTEYLHEDNPLIQKIMRSSITGMCLAQAESICQSSIEFLYNGIPVITTLNDTGRMEWFNENNSIIIPDINPDTISESVEQMKKRVLDGEINPILIREETISRMKSYGREFRRMVSLIFLEFNKPDISDDLLKRKFEHHFLYQKHWKDLDKTLDLFK